MTRELSHDCHVRYHMTNELSHECHVRYRMTNELSHDCYVSYHALALQVELPGSWGDVANLLNATDHPPKQQARGQRSTHMRPQ